MKRLYSVCLFLVIIGIIPTTHLAVTRIICTSALTDAHYEFRKKQYITAFNTLHQLGYKDFYIVEAIKKSPTFLEDYSKNVFYATVNNPNLKNHGINEARTLLEACEHFNFDPEDMVIKLTGRHRVTSDYLMKMVENNPDVDVFVKKNVTQKGYLYTIGYAMRYKHLKNMLENINYDAINDPVIAIEEPFDAYVKTGLNSGSFKVLYLNKLDMVADIFGSTTLPGSPAVTVKF